MQKTEIKIGQTVYLSFSEQYWNKPFPMKRSDVYDTRYVILKGKVTDIRNREFKAVLFENNGFEKDGEEFVFNMGQLLDNQSYQDKSSLGKWNKN